MQSAKQIWDTVAFNRYVREMQGYLADYFGMKADPESIRLAAEYFARGRSAAYCAYALARHNRVRTPT